MRDTPLPPSFTNNLYSHPLEKRRLTKTKGVRIIQHGHDEEDWKRA
jgi:hypothetical protein